MTAATTHASAPTEAPLGPDSLTWEFFGDLRMLLLGPRAAVLQNMLPTLAQGVEDHSVWFRDTMGRLGRSVPPIQRTVYGRSPDDTGREVRDFHRDIKGKLPDGGHYSALNPATYYWAHATFVEHMLTATETFIRPLSTAEKDRAIAESVTWYRRYGVSEQIGRPLPSTWAEFTGYWDTMMADEVVGHRIARYGVGYATKGWPRPAQVPRPVWWVVRRPLDKVSSFLTIGGMPERGRELLDLPWSARQQASYDRFARVVRALHPVVRRLPRRLSMAPIAARAFAREGR